MQSVDILLKINLSASRDREMTCVSSPVQMLPTVEAVCSYLKPLQVACLRFENAGVDSRRCIRRPLLVCLDPATLDNARLEQVNTLLDNIELHKPPMSCLGIGDRI